MSKWSMRGHFGHLRFKTFPMTPRKPQCEVFWTLLSNSKNSRVLEDSKSPTLGVWVSSSHLAKVGLRHTCSCFQTTWKPTSHVMVPKVPMRSLPWAQYKRWIPIGSMGSVHAHWGRPVIEECGSLSHSKTLWKKWGKIIERLGRLVKL
jgi:hypothetical protein